MFLCVSANPAIDKRISVRHFRAGAVNRAIGAVPEPGGKAAHVAMTLRGLGMKSSWIGFAGGATGQELVAGLERLGIECHAVRSRQPTRVNLAIVDEAAIVTEILEPGHPPSITELRIFRKQCEREFARGRSRATVILSGSLPAGTPSSLYARLIESARRNGCRVFLDSSGDALRAGIQAHPDLVKPNREEAEALTGKAIRGVVSARRALMQIVSLGAKSAALSLGREGLLWCAGPGQPVFHAQPPVVTGRSAVGSEQRAPAGVDGDQRARRGLGPAAGGDPFDRRRRRVRHVRRRRPCQASRRSSASRESRR